MRGHEGAHPPRLAKRITFVSAFLELLLAPLVLLWLATVAIGYLMVTRAVDQPFDQRLEDVVRVLATELQTSGEPQQALRVAPAALALLANDRADRSWYALRRGNGELIAGSSDVPVPARYEDEGATLEDAEIEDEPVRVATLTLPDLVRPGERMVLQVAETLHKRERLARTLHAESLLPLVVVVLGALGLTWYALVFVVRPMRRLRVAIDRRDAEDLTPLDVESAPRELQPLIDSINGLMGRLAINFEDQRRFIANAAHQLRTPLAGLKTQTELALSEDDSRAIRRALEQLETATNRAIHLANRLLALARAGHRPALPRAFVELVPLAREVVRDVVAAAVDAGVDLGFEGPAEGVPVRVRGDPLLLREMVANLVDNALRYTPAGGSVTVSVEHTPVPAMVVTDTGPGIPAAERERVLQPFVRGIDQSGPGSGLGLAIVHEIARSHGASMVIEDGPDARGTRIAIRFDRLPVSLA